MLWKRPSFDACVDTAALTHPQTPTAHQHAQVCHRGFARRPPGALESRRPKPAKGHRPSGSAPAGLEGGDLNRCEAENFEGDASFCEPAVPPEIRTTTKPKSSRRNPAARSQSSPPRSDSGDVRRTATATASPPKFGKTDRGSNGRRDAAADNLGGVRGGKLTPQPIYMGRAGGPRRRDGDEASGGGGGVGGAVMLHKGVVITDELRNELLNPMAHHRFKLLRGAH